MKATKLIFEKYTIEPQEKTLSFYYSYNTGEEFCEKLIIDSDWDLSPAQEKALDQAAFGLWVMMGISYFKAFLPEEIVFKNAGLTAEQAAFFTKVYQHGLGELFVVNELDPHDRIHFPVDSDKADGAVLLADELQGSLVAIGGGKDSLTSVELLKSVGEDITAWSTWSPELIQPMMDKIGRPSVNVKRILPPELIALGNNPEAYKGHVPFSAIYSFIGVAVSIVTGKKNAVFSNEASAEQPNLIYRDLPINHQYSKSLAYEQDFQEYVTTFISPDVQYFSFLRPLTELHIAQIFGERYLDTYFGIFSSCNKNWRQSGVSGLGWCGRCPKCAFVFLIFSPFVPKARLLELFGHDLLADESLTDMYNEIFGLSGYKPFECIGEVEEARAAARMAHESGDYPAVERFGLVDEAFDYQSLRPHAMPDEYYKKLKEALDS